MHVFTQTLAANGEDHRALAFLRRSKALKRRDPAHAGLFCTAAASMVRPACRRPCQPDRAASPRPPPPPPPQLALRKLEDCEELLEELLQEALPLDLPHRGPPHSVATVHDQLRAATRSGRWACDPAGGNDDLSVRAAAAATTAAGNRRAAAPDRAPTRSAGSPRSAASARAAMPSAPTPAARGSGTLLLCSWTQRRQRWGPLPRRRGLRPRPPLTDPSPQALDALTEGMLLTAGDCKALRSHMRGLGAGWEWLHLLTQAKLSTYEPDTCLPALRALAGDHGLGGSADVVRCRRRCPQPASEEGNGGVTIHQINPSSPALRRGVVSQRLRGDPARSRCHEAVRAGLEVAWRPCDTHRRMEFFLFTHSR